MMQCDCKHCEYRIALARILDIHIWKSDCDKYETEFCKNMNNIWKSDCDKYETEFCEKMNDRKEKDT